MGFQQLDLDYDSASDSVDNWCGPALSHHNIAMQNQSNRRNSTETPLIVEQFWLGNVTKVLYVILNCYVHVLFSSTFNRFAFTHVLYYFVHTEEIFQNTMLDLSVLWVLRGFRIGKRKRVAMLLMTTGRMLADWRDIQHIERLGYIRLKFYI